MRTQVKIQSSLQTELKSSALYVTSEEFDISSRETFTSRRVDDLLILCLFQSYGPVGYPVAFKFHHLISS
ncbi:hypothetical protein Mapa_009712 [Marchantia paleacea]|nr:hypothetical protein Mapa_009712 [Marchantia paleacea]